MGTGKKTRHPTTTEDDLQEVVEFLQSKNILPSRIPARVLNATRKMHSLTYSVILWRFRLPSLPEHGRVFLDEVASDALQVLPQALMGYRKTTTLLIRGLTENLLRHIYFSDHPVEFQRINRDKRWFIQTEDLFDYIKQHPTYYDTEKKFDAINRLKTLYHDLSAGLHGQKVTHLELRRSLREIRFEQSVFDEQVLSLKKCAEATNFLLSAFHIERFRKFPQETRMIILRTMPPKARQILSGLA